jgi:hypothetical protein
MTGSCSRSLLRGLIALFICVASAGRASYGQQGPALVSTDSADAADGGLPNAPGVPGAATVQGLPLAVLKDQIPIWTSPIRVRPNDLFWLLPLGAAAGVTLSTDTDTMREVSHDPKFNKDNVNVSNYALGGELAVPAVMFGISYLTANDHAHEASVLSGEAVADGLIMQEVLKVIFRRERPLYNNAEGNFFAPVGTGGSLPSSHATLAWATAAVIAGEYPSRWVQVSMYTTATAVSLTRVLGQEHFPTDVLVGGATGWLIGHYVFKKHSQYRTLYGLLPKGH